MDQEFINWVFAICSGVFGWFGREMWSAVKELKADLAKLREELPKEYVAKVDIEKRFDKLDRVLEQIWHELRDKMDKKD